jgi:hypothetical protein
VTVANKYVRRRHPLAGRSHLGAARSKGAAWREIGEIRWRAGDGGEALALGARAAGAGGQQASGVWVSRRANDVAAGSGLDDLSCITAMRSAISLPCFEHCS